MTGPGLKPHQRCNPRSYVTGRDFRGWKTGLCQAHGGELRQWSRQDELSTTAAAILAFLSVFHGLRSGPEGCGVQMTLEGWSKLLGRSRRAVAYAFDQLDARGLVRRRRRLVKVDWVDDSGKARTRADVWGVAYLTKLGAVRIARRGETRRLMVRAGRSERVLVCAGSCGKPVENAPRRIARDGDSGHRRTEELHPLHQGGERRIITTRRRCGPLWARAVFTSHGSSRLSRGQPQRPPQSKGIEGRGSPFSRAGETLVAEASDRADRVARRLADSGRARPAVAARAVRARLPARARAAARGGVSAGRRQRARGARAGRARGAAATARPRRLTRRLSARLTLPVRRTGRALRRAPPAGRRIRHRRARG
jgi:hypothetical protein